MILSALVAASAHFLFIAFIASSADTSPLSTAFIKSSAKSSADFPAVFKISSADFPIVDAPLVPLAPPDGEVPFGPPDVPPAAPAASSAAPAMSSAAPATSSATPAAPVAKSSAAEPACFALNWLYAFPIFLIPQSTTSTVAA